MKTLNQAYAADAYERVTRIAAEHNAAYQKKYGTMAHRLPILLRTAGLAQALSFVYAKGTGTPAWRQYLDDVAQAVDYPDGRALLEDSQRLELRQYMMLTHRLGQALVWYKRFAESILKVEQSMTDDLAEPLNDEEVVQ